MILIHGEFIFAPFDYTLDACRIERAAAQGNRASINIKTLHYLNIVFRQKFERWFYVVMRKIQRPRSFSFRRRRVTIYNNTFGPTDDDYQIRNIFISRPSEPVDFIYLSMNFFIIFPVRFWNVINFKIIPTTALYNTNQISFHRIPGISCSKYKLYIIVTFHSV